MLDYAFNALLERIRQNTLSQFTCHGIGEQVYLQGKVNDLRVHWEGDEMLEVDIFASLPDGTVISGGSYKKMRHWDPRSGKCLQVEDQSMQALAVLSDGSVISYGGGKFWHWDFQVGKCLNSWDTYKINTKQLAVLPDNSLFFFSDNDIYHLDILNNHCLGWWEDKISYDFGLSSNNLVVLHDGSVLSGHSDKVIRRWDPQTGECLAKWIGHTEAVTALAVLPDNSVVSASRDKSIRRWDLQGHCLAVWDKQDGTIEGLVALPDGSVVSSSGKSYMRRWDPEIGKCLGKWQFTGQVKSLFKTLTPLSDGSMVAAGVIPASGSFNYNYNYDDDDYRPEKYLINHWPKIGPDLTQDQCLTVLKALATNTSVTALTIRDGILTDELYDALALVIQRHAALTTLTLERCGFTDDNLEPLLLALGSPTSSVIDLQIEDDDLSEESIEKLQQAIKQRKALTVAASKWHTKDCQYKKEIEDLHNTVAELKIQTAQLLRRVTSLEALNAQRTEQLKAVLSDKTVQEKWNAPNKSHWRQLFFAGIPELSTVESTLKEELVIEKKCHLLD